MHIHKNNWLTPEQLKAIYQDYFTDNHRVADLASDYWVSRPPIYSVLHRRRRQDFSVHTSTNQRFRCLGYGIKRLSSPI